MKGYTVDTSRSGGGTLFGFTYSPPVILEAIHQPRQFQRVEIDLGKEIVEGVIAAKPIKLDAASTEGDGWMLRISTQADLSGLSQTQRENVGVRLCG